MAFQLAGPEGRGRVILVVVVPEEYPNVLNIICFTFCSISENWSSVNAISVSVVS
jgi:hypothetical protein